jgi:hypothetical protein
MTEQGLDWDNSAHVSDDNFALMDLMRTEAPWLELGVHGVRHEHWENGHRKRAEFGERNGHGWGNPNTALHLQCFEDLLRQYRTPQESSFPVSFVPPNHGFENAPDGETSTGAMLAAFGVRFAQKPGRTAFDHGVFWMSRDTSASPAYNAVAALPGRAPSDASWVMTHLPNFYGEEDAWVRWLQGIDGLSARWLPRNSAQAASQLLYAQHVRFSSTDEGGSLGRLDTRDVPADGYQQNVLGPLVLKVALESPPGDDAGAANDEASVSLDVTASGGLKVIARTRDAAHHEIVYLGDPEQPQGAVPPGVFDVQVSHSSEQEGDYVELGSSTANVFSLRRVTPDSHELELEAYGRQTMDVVLPDSTVNVVQSTHDGLHVVDWSWDATRHRLHLTVEGDDVQGERGIVRLDP